MRRRCALLTLVLLAIAARTRADGTMVVRDRALFREGSADRGYCEDGSSGSPEECARVLTKVLSGYSYGRGNVSGGITADRARLSGVGALRIHLIAAALPGGEMSLATVDTVIGDAATRRLRVTLMDAEGLFVCHDAQSDSYVAPIVGMFTRACLPDARVAVEMGLLAMQWDISTDRLLGEWVRLGPAFELLANGFGYAHLSKSILISAPIDLRSLHYSAVQRDTDTSLGAGLKISAFYRSPQWELRGVVRQRMTLAGGAGLSNDHSVEGELRFLHNFFLSDSIVAQAGLSVRGSLSERPERTFAVWARADRQWSGFAGFHLGWVHEPPDI